MRGFHILFVVILLSGCIMATAPEAETTQTTETTVTTTTLPPVDLQRFDECYLINDNETARDGCFRLLAKDFEWKRLCDSVAASGEESMRRQRQERCLFYFARALNEKNVCDGITDPMYSDKCKIDVDPASVKCNCTKSVNRVVSGDDDERLISLAENTSCPNGQWWYGEATSPKTMKCVNIDTLNYYLGMVDRLSQNASYLGAPTTMSYVMYSAHVFRQVNAGQYDCAGKDDELSMVDLNLEYFNSCGKYCGQGQRHYRTVVFNSTRQVCATEGDDVNSITFVS
jgi:hypothetical protein